MVGFNVGSSVGSCVRLPTNGDFDGLNVGSFDGYAVVGKDVVGSMDGCCDGNVLGFDDGMVGLIVGSIVGFAVG